ncbi:MAG TPA: peptidase S8 [Clostridiales bacterium]|nr:peptidase S8 [Clostridiales bacterium]
MIAQARLVAVSLVLVLVLALAGIAGLSPQVEASPPAEFASGRILVRFRPGTPAAEVASAHGLNRGQVLEVLDRIGAQVIRVPAGDELRAVARYRANPNVLYAEVDGAVRALGFTPNDPMLPDQWGLARVEATLAWGVTRGSSAIRIAILDTGIDAGHRDINPKVVLARNFTTSPTVNDRNGHGTHVAGIAAAVTNNARGIAGLGFDSVLMNGKVLGDNGSGTWSWVASGIIWATDNGARVINLSLGGTSHSATLEDAVNYAWSRGVVVVAAAGNSNTSTLTYPAAYVNAIAVGATDRNDARATFSNFGTWVDVAAPGVDILSTFPRDRLGRDRYRWMSGTSMSAPFVAGLAGLVWATQWGTSNVSVRDRIQATVDPISTDQPIGGRINAARAVGAK